MTSIIARLNRLEAHLDEIEDDGDDGIRREFWSQPDPTRNYYIRHDGVSGSEAELLALGTNHRGEWFIRKYIGVPVPGPIARPS